MGLSQKDVIAVCEALNTDGTPLENITGHSVWKVLGRGSKSTVQKYTASWKAMQNTPTPLTLTSASKAIQDVIDQLVAQAVADEQQRASATISELEEERRQLSRALASALGDNERLAQEITELAAVERTNNDARNRAEAERDWLKGQLAERDEELADALAGRVNRERTMQKAAERLAAGMRPKF